MTDMSKADKSHKSENRKRFLNSEWTKHTRSTRKKISSPYLALAAAGLLTLTYYPGAFYYDVIRQFNWVKSISDSLRHGVAELPDDFISWWPVWNTLFRDE
jgi:IS5 family transposase